jgi:hypothetical protein
MSRCKLRTPWPIHFKLRTVIGIDSHTVCIPFGEKWIASPFHGASKEFPGLQCHQSPQLALYLKIRKKTKATKIVLRSKLLESEYNNCKNELLSRKMSRLDIKNRGMVFLLKIEVWYFYFIIMEYYSP